MGTRVDKRATYPTGVFPMPLLHLNPAERAGLSVSFSEFFFKTKKGNIIKL